MLTIEVPLIVKNGFVRVLVPTAKVPSTLVPIIVMMTIDFVKTLVPIIIMMTVVKPLVAINVVMTIVMAPCP